MSTRSRIAVEAPSSEIVNSCYCHWDGYVRRVGRILQEFWKEPEQVLELVSHGDMCQLDEDIAKTVYFSRDNKKLQEEYGDTEDRSSEIMVEAFPSKEVMVEKRMETLEEYFYVFNMETKTWMVCNCYDGLPFKPLQDALEQERKESRR